MSNLKHVIRGRDKDTLNILTFPTHERYETNLAKTGHNFYSFHLKDSKKWSHDHMPTPENYYILPEANLCSFIDYDLILVQSKFWQYQVASKINQSLRLPVVVLEHTVPLWEVHKKEDIQNMSSMRGHANIFISEFSRKDWGFDATNSSIIHHGVDTSAFYDESRQRDDSVLTVANQFKDRDYCLNFTLWSRVVEGFNVKLAGDNPGISSPVKSVDELREIYNTCGVYFNSTNFSPIPTTILEAMACGCPIVSTATCAIPEFVKHGYNGFLSNDETELRAYLHKLISDKELATIMGKRSAEIIKEHLSLNKFVGSWNNLFQKVVEVFK